MNRARQVLLVLFLAWAVVADDTSLWKLMQEQRMKILEQKRQMEKQGFVVEKYEVPVHFVAAETEPAVTPTKKKIPRPYIPKPTPVTPKPTPPEPTKKPEETKPTPKPTLSKIPDSHMVKIYGDDLTMYYWMHIMVGNPPVKQSVIIDTGSDYTAVPCNCAPGDCGTHDYPPLVVKESAAFLKCGAKFGNYVCKNCDYSRTNCTFYRHYAEGSSLAGQVMIQPVKFGDKGENMDAQEDDDHNIKDPIKIPVGCTNQETGMFLPQKANGIMGLYYNSNTEKFGPNLIDQLYSGGHISTRGFSLCFGTFGGFLTLGKMRTDRHKKGAKVQKLNYIENTNYMISIYSIKVGNKEVYRKYGRDTRASMKLDSGTTFAYFHADLGGPLIKAIAEFCQKSPKNCGGSRIFSGDTCFSRNKALHPTHQEFLDSFPTVQLKLGLNGEVDYTWSPRNYLRYLPNVMDPRSPSYCNTMMEASPNSTQLLGSMFMRGRDFHFDRLDRRVTIVDANCDSIQPTYVEE